MSAEAGRQNYIADMAAIEFECSIAAAELNKHVHQAFESSNGESVHNYVIGYGEEATVVRCVYTNWFYDFHGEKFPILLFGNPPEPNPKPQAQAQPQSSRKFLAPWSVKRPPASPQPQQSRWRHGIMLGLAMDYTILPLASFEDRLGEDTCSYVQLGSEVNGDSVFATKLDEMGPRNNVIEALRDIATKSPPYYKSGWESAPSDIQKLLDNELLRNEAAVSERFGYMLARAGNSFVKNNPHMSEVVGISRLGETPAGDAGLEFAKVWPLSGPVEYSPQKSGRFGIVENGTKLEIGFIARSSLFAPLITLEDGSATPNLVSAIPDVILRNLTLTLTARNIDHQHSKYSRKESMGDYVYVGTADRPKATSIPSTELPDFVAVKLGLCAKDPLSGKTFTPDETTISTCYAGWQRAVNACLRRPDWAQNLPKEDPLYSAFIAHQPVYRDLFEQLGGRQALASLGEQAPVKESLLHCLGRLCTAETTRATGRMTNLQIGKTKGSLDFEAEIRRDGASFDVRIGTRPSSMPQERFRPMFSEVFNSLFGTDMSAAKVKDTLDVLNILERV